MSMRINVVGVGGIGQCLLNPLPLLRYLTFERPDAEFTLIDGDIFEEKNRSRQNFTKIGRNKAEDAAERLSKECPGLYFRAEPVYIDKHNSNYLIDEGDITFCCPDNHATRKCLSNRYSQLNDGILISGGNEYTEGNVIIYIRQNGKDITLPLTNQFHKDIIEPTDENPAERQSCEVIVASSPQLVITNSAVASAMINSFYSWLQGTLHYDEVFIDIVTGRVRTVSRTTQLRENKQGGSTKNERE